MSQISQIKKIYHAAIYVRLSKEDGAVASHEKAESNSIANQKSLIREFLKSKNDKLEEVVLELLQTHIDNIVDLKRILSFIGNVPFQQLDMKKLEERREKKQAEVDRCAELRGMLYEDMKDGIISKEDYKELHAAYEQRKKNAEISIHQIELEMDDVLNRKSKGFVWLDYFTEHQNIEKLTREVVVSLIREIKVFDKNHIEVIFDFDDCYKECLDVIESQGHFVEVDSMGKLNIRLKEAV